MSFHFHFIIKFLLFILLHVQIYNEQKQTKKLRSSKKKFKNNLMLTEPEKKLHKNISNIMSNTIQEILKYLQSHIEKDNFTIPYYSIYVHLKIILEPAIRKTIVF